MALRAWRGHAAGGFAGSSRSLGITALIRARATSGHSPVARRAAIPPASHTSKAVTNAPASTTKSKSCHPLSGCVVLRAGSEEDATSGHTAMRASVSTSARSTRPSRFQTRNTRPPIRHKATPRSSCGKSDACALGSPSSVRVDWTSECGWP